MNDEVGAAVALMWEALLSSTLVKLLPVARSARCVTECHECLIQVPRRVECQKANHQVQPCGMLPFRRTQYIYIILKPLLTGTYIFSSLSGYRSRYLFLSSAEKQALTHVPFLLLKGVLGLLIYETFYLRLIKISSRSSGN